MTRPRTYAAALLGATALLYLPVLGLGFASDDRALLQALPAPFGPAAWVHHLRQDLWHFQDSPSGYWRPLLTASLVVDRALWGQEPWGYHLQSLAWYLVGVGLFHHLLRRAFGPERAVVGAAVLAFHPVSVEAAAWVAARNDPMALALALGAVSLTWSERPGPLRRVAAAALAAAACLAKEHAPLVLALGPLLAWACRPDTRAEGPRPSWEPVRQSLPLVAGVAAALAARAALGPTSRPPMDAADLLLARLPQVLATLLGKLVWPWPLTDSLHLVYLPDPPWVAAALCLALLLALARAGGRGGRAGALLAVAGLPPALLAIASRHLLGERYLLLPLLGLSVALCAALPRRPWAPALALLLVPLAPSVQARLRDWQDDEHLARAAWEADPNPYTAAMMARALDLSGKGEQALEWHARALQGDPPACLLAGDMVRSTLRLRGPQAATHVARAAWDRGCGGAPGLRGQWASALLRAGDEAGARRILDPPPARCDGHLALPVGVLALRDGDEEALERCARQAGLEVEALRAAAARVEALAGQEATSGSGEP
ncbi:hypothetical protein L6R53_25365 [Myxococcota bacterium]|nr:hypothetical protein [Myxococcota bacterium]